MIGKEIRLQRLFNGNRDAENIVIFAVDHGMFQGVQAGLERLPSAVEHGLNADAVENVEPDEWHVLIKTGCRILCELGADMIKTFYTDERFTEITASLPIPVFVLGSKKLPRELDALQLAENAVRCGARGIAFGRNIFQSRDPRKTIDALKRVVRKQCSAIEAAESLSEDSGA